MWSRRATDIVTRLIANLPAEQRDPARTDAVRLNALPIGESMWASYYLRPNGEVVIVGAEYNQPDIDTISTRRENVLKVLVWGSERHPELRELIPRRPASAVDCGCARHPHIFGPRKIICPTCCGLGWIDPTDDQSRNDSR